tara:strand:+ start:2322 stop:2678 length:357 start_codon:yes stop_codon:yes gene_type:complete
MKIRKSDIKEAIRGVLAEAGMNQPGSTGMGNERVKGKEVLFSFQNTSGSPIKLKNISKGSFDWRPNDYLMVIGKKKGYGGGTDYTGFLQGKFKGYPKSTFKIKSSQIKGMAKRVKVKK